MKCLPVGAVDNRSSDVDQGGGDSDIDTQRHTPVSLPDTVGPEKKRSTPNTSDRITQKQTTNVILAQGKPVHDL